MLAILLACGPGPAETDPGETGDVPDTGDTGPYTPATGPCDALDPGPGADVAVPVAIAAASAGIRMFGPEADWAATDARLAATLQGDIAWDADLFDTWAAGMGACHALATSSALGAGSVELVDGVAIVRPGTGTITLPDGARAVVVDVRHLPPGSATDTAIRAAAGLALATEVSSGTRLVRRFEGFPQQWGSGSIYTSRRLDVPITVSPRGTADLPLIFWTSRRLSPEAATLAGGLRMAGRAWIVGYDVQTGVAESALTPSADGALAWRSAALELDDVQWPDVIPADVPTNGHEDADLADLGVSAPPVAGAGERPAFAKLDPITGEETSGMSEGERRAALLLVHGVLARFWGYRGYTPQAELDAALIATLGEITPGTGDRDEMVHTLGRLLHAYHDGHAFFGDASDAASVPDGYLALQVQRVGADAVVRASAEDGVLPGDTIVSVDGAPASSWLDEVMSRKSAATDGYLFDLAVRELLEVHGTRTLGLRDPDGSERTVTLSPVHGRDDVLVPWGGTWRPSGPLDDLGAPDLVLLNLNGEVTTSDADYRDAMEAAATATGLIVDMRDYPGINHYAVAMDLNLGPFHSPVFNVPLWKGPDVSETSTDQYDFDGAAAFDGPVVLLVSNKTVSAAENFSQMIVGREDLVVVGQNSAGTNGNITGMLLPGGLYAMFTGMEVLDPDGTPFHGIGVVPDVVVTATAADFRDGIDPELEAAIAAF